nr:riboflavin transporter 2 A [Hymenolepis microstoma]
MALDFENNSNSVFDPNSGPSIIEPDDDHVAQVSFSWWNAIFLIFFGVSAWVAINGLWMELPLLVNVLPEGWNLPAYLSIIIQLANIGPIFYVLLTRICRKFGRADSGSWFMRLIQPPERLANYTILIIGLISSLLLTQFWDAVAYLPGLPENTVYVTPVTLEALHNHSLGLFILTFLLGMIDCMSSVTFLAYLANMPPVYTGALLFGETTSGLLPGLYALGQGVNSEPKCVQVPNGNGTTDITPIYDPPNFSVSVFMGLIAATTGLSLLAFFLLDCIPMGLGRSVTLAYQRHHSLPPVNENDENQSKSSEAMPSSAIEQGVQVRTLSPKGLFWVCFLLTGYSSCLTNGLLPSLQSYSTASYNILTFHLAVTLSGITAPLAALVVTAFYGNDQLGSLIRSVICCRRNRAVMMGMDSMEGNNQEARVALRRDETKMSSILGSRLAIILSTICLIGTLFAAYIIYLAAASPSAPKLGGAGPAFSIIAWILMTAAFNIQNTWIILHLVKYGTQRNLRTLGIASQMGSAIGALISFLITAEFKLFVSRPACT